jgi:hypothetical protein
LAPVVIVDGPEGPLMGPVEVTFDLSASYDPEEEPITDYVFSTSDSDPHTQPGPIITKTLHPGCHTILLGVVAGGRSGSTIRQLKVLPRWEPTPSLVYEDPGEQVRGLFFTLGNMPGSGANFVASYDRYMRQAFFAEEVEGELQPNLIPVNEEPEFICEPAYYGSHAATCVLTTDRMEVIVYNGTMAYEIFSRERENNERGVVVGNGDDLWALYTKFSAGTYDLVLNPITTTDSNTDLLTGIDKVNWLDAVYNSVSDAIDIFYTDDGSNDIIWYRHYFNGDPPINTVMWAADAQHYDLEFNDAEGHLCYIHFDGTHYQYAELDEGTLMWDAPTPVNDAANNGVISNLAIGDDGTAYAAILFPGGVAKIMENSGGWTERGEVTGVTGFLFYSGELDAIDGTDDVMYACLQADAGIHGFRMGPDGTPTEAWVIPSYGPTGGQLTGAGGSDGLHLVYKDEAGTGVHLTSSDGDTWTVTSNPTGTDNYSMTADEEGNVHLSYFETPKAYLMTWDGAMWVEEHNVDAIVDHIPILGMNPEEGDIRWQVYNDGTGMLHFVSGSHGGAFAEWTQTYSGSPIWFGASPSQSGNETLGYCGPALNNSEVFQWKWNAADNDFLFDADDDEELSGDTYFTRTRTLDAANFYYGEYLTSCSVFYSANSPNYGPARISEDLFGDYFIIESLQEGLPENEGLETRRTVSVENTKSSGCVAVINSLDGSETWFEWDNFGEWESLPYPVTDPYAHNAKLIIGFDGRWHIIYRNWWTDELYCLSTLPAVP